MHRLLLKLRRRRHLHDDLAEELAFHEDEARRHGNAIPLGATIRITEDSLDLWRFARLENLWRDVLYATRGLLHSPALVVSAMLSLGLGIGVNTAMFSLAASLMLSRPSVSDPASLVSVQLGGNSHASPDAFSMLRDAHVFREVVGQNEEVVANFDDGEQTRPVFAFAVTKNYFSVLGLPVAHGRGIVQNDPDEVVVLNHEFWRKHFNSDPSLVGRSIRLEGKPYTVVGILPADHRTLIGFGFTPDVYIPSYLHDTILAITARLEPGESMAVARERVRAVSQRIDATYPSEFKYVDNISVESVDALPFLKGDLVTIGLFFALLLLVVALVLLLASVNVAGLLLARASARRRELAIRLSLGASRGRLLQQLLVESVLLAAMGAVAGLALAGLTGALIERIELPVPVPIRLHVDLDWRVGLYAALMTLLAAAASGLLPAWQAVREAISVGLHRERRHRIRRLLIVGQVAVSVVVLAAAGLFVRNLMAAHAISPGFDVTRTIRAEVNLPAAAYATPADIQAFVDRALPTLRALPGIDGAATARTIPFNGATRNGDMLTFADANEKVLAQFNSNAVTPDFFRVLDIPLLQGRDFSATDRNGESVIIVNQAFVRRYLGSRLPVGTVVKWGPDGVPRRIIGVVGNTKTMTVGEDDKAQLYEPLAQIRNNRRRLQFVLRSSATPSMQLNAVRRTLRGIEPGAGLEVATMYSSIGLAFLPSQIGAALMGFVGVLALILAAVGLYGVMAYSVARRLPEIGLRMALGATRPNISRLVLGDAVRLVVTGATIGLIGALLVIRPLSMFLVAGLTPNDPMTFTLVLVVLMLTALLAAWGPVYRASRVDPMRVLRED